MGSWSGCWREAVRTKGVPGSARRSALGRHAGAGLWAEGPSSRNQAGFIGTVDLFVIRRFIQNLSVLPGNSPDVFPDQSSRRCSTNGGRETGFKGHQGESLISCFRTSRDSRGLSVSRHREG